MLGKGHRGKLVGKKRSRGMRVVKMAVPKIGDTGPFSGRGARREKGTVVSVLGTWGAVRKKGPGYACWEANRGDTGPFSPKTVFSPTRALFLTRGLFHHF